MHGKGNRDFNSRILIWCLGILIYWISWVSLMNLPMGCKYYLFYYHKYSMESLNRKRCYSFQGGGIKRKLRWLGLDLTNMSKGETYKRRITY